MIIHLNQNQARTNIMESVILGIILCVFVLYDKHMNAIKFEKVLTQHNDLSTQLNRLKLEIQHLNKDLVTIIEENRSLNKEVFKLSDEVCRLRLSYMSHVDTAPEERLT